MKNVLGIAGVLLSCICAGPVLAQSQQGGSLGLELAASLMPKRLAPASSFATSPAAWCDYSVDTDRCRGRAEPDHKWCMAHAPDHYATCRQTMDYIGWHL